MDVGGRAGDGQPAELHRRSRLRDLGGALLPAHALPRDEGGRGGRGLVDFGMRALLSMRLEKNWPTWFAELRPIYGACEGGMERFVRLDKDFIGRDAAAREAEAGPRLRRVSLAIEAENADVMGDEPIWARVDRDCGAVAPPHGIGAPRFDADGTRGAGGRRAARRRLAGGRLGDLGRLRPLGGAVAGAGLPAGGAGRARRGRALRGRDPRGAPAGADRWSSRRSIPTARGCGRSPATRTPRPRGSCR